jgi:hypothetical protein
MQEPYAIENTLAKDAVTGNPMAATLMDQYWFERQQREGQYADRMANQMQFGQQQLHAQLQDSYLKALPDITKAGLLPAVASSPYFGGAVQGMDPTALQSASDLATSTAQSGVYKNYGQGTQGFATAGLNIPPGPMSTATGVPGITQGTPIAVQAQAEHNKGLVQAAGIRAAGSGGPQWQYASAPDEAGGTMTLKGRGAPPTNLAPASPAANQAQRPPPNYTRAPDALTTQVQTGIEGNKGNNSAVYKDMVSGYIGNKPNTVVDGQGNVFVVGKSGKPWPVGKMGSNKQ